MFFYFRIREKQFFILPVVNDNGIVRSTSDGVEGKSGLRQDSLALEAILVIFGRSVGLNFFFV